MDMTPATQATTPAFSANKPKHGVDKMATIDKASKDFEAMFVSQMLQPMFESVEVNETFGGGHGEQVMRSLMVQEYGKAVAATGTFGMSDSIKAEMIRMQGMKTQNQEAEKAASQAAAVTAASYAATSYANGGRLQ